MNQAVHFIGGEWVMGDGQAWTSTNPSRGEVVWEGCQAGREDVELAVKAARQGFEGPWFETTAAERIAYVKRFGELIEAEKEALAVLIVRENGKPLWEARQEAGAVVGKVGLAIASFEQRCGLSEFEVGGGLGVTRYKAHGVVGVLGPFNLPAHLPNGHIIPALLAGNTVVFKPSEQTPGVGDFYMRLWEKVGLPAGVLNMVQGGGDTGRALVESEGIDGLFFTGSSRVGLAIHQYMGDYPEKIVALEMGGNNPLIVHETKDLRAGAYQTILSAFITSGQRCTCARRLIVPQCWDEADAFVAVLKEMMGKMRVGDGLGDGVGKLPFMGPVISRAAGEKLLAGQEALVEAGGVRLVEMEAVDGHTGMLKAGLMDVTGVSDLSDEEMFGPFLQLIRVKDFDQAITCANGTRYGLSAGLISDREDLYREFIKRIRAGVVNWNRQTTGASGRLAFGGVGRSGNHRPSGFYAADYCAYPVASLEIKENVMPQDLVEGIDW